MKVKRIFRGSIAGLVSMSLLLAGMPVLAEEADNGRQVEAEGETPISAGEEQIPQEPKVQEETPAPAEVGETQPQAPSDGDNQPPREDLEAEGNQEGNPEGKNPSQDKIDTEPETHPGTEESGKRPGEEKGTEEGAEEPGKEQDTGKDTEEGPGKEQDTGKGTEEGTGKEQDTGKGTEEGPGKEQDAGKSTEEGTGKEQDTGKGTEEKNGEKDTEEVIQDIPQLFSLHNLPTVNGNIVIDGDLSDWEEVTARSSNVANVESWKAAFSQDGNTLYFCYTGSAGTEWDYTFAGNGTSIRFAFSDGITGEDQSLCVSAGSGGAVVKNAFWGDVPGGAAAVTNSANGNNAGPYTVEFSVPASFFHSLDFTLSFGDVSINSGEIEQINGVDIAIDVPAVYTSITIDGDYSDWAAVGKADVSCPNDQHPGCLSLAAAVYDGDWFYIYMKDGEGSNASGAGSHSNGKFAIVSDLGYETDIQLSTAPAVSGVNGAQVSYVGSEWEIAIPKDQLPKYKESLSFGFYLGDAIVSDIVNLKPDSGNNLENLFDGIVYDGAYEDWEDYGHSTIQYATPGSQESQVDAKGALYSSGDKLYGHVVTTMPQHLQEAGGEFTSAVTIAFNQSAENLQNGSYDYKMAFYPRYVTVDGDGTINWNPQLSGFADGTYEFYIASTDAWGTSANVNDLNDMDQMYGKMIMTIGKDGKDEMEYYLELPMIAKKLGVDETDLKEIAAQYGRIGQQWIYTAGTSTGPVAGVVLSIVSAGAVLWYKKKNLHEILFGAAK